MTRFFNLIFILCLSSCANIIPPNGGDKDVNSPKILQSTPNNNQINFKSDNIEIKFDEKIIVSDFYQYFYISPPIKEKVKYEVKGDKLIIKLGQELNKNTSYYLSLGNCIKDLNEGNVANDLSLSFSTGNIIDTLTIKGEAIDIKTGEKLNNIFVSLYTYDANKNRPEFKNEIPDYISKTNENGHFKFTNLKNQQYYLYAFEDLDNNQKLNLPNERLGFTDTIISSKSFQNVIKLYSEESSIDTIFYAYADSSSDYGKLIIDSIPQNHFSEILNNDKVIFRGFKSPLILDSLATGEYKIRIIEDKNQNQKWDSGNIETFTQAENIIFYPNKIQVRLNWDLEIVWKSK